MERKWIMAKLSERVRMLRNRSPGLPCSSQTTHLPMSPYTLEGGMNDRRQEDGEKMVGA